MVASDSPWVANHLQKGGMVRSREPFKFW